MSAAPQQHAAIIGLLSLLQAPFMKSSFYRRIARQAWQQTDTYSYAHKGKRGKVAAWTTLVYVAGIAPVITWRIELNDRRLGCWLFKVRETGVCDLKWIPGNKRSVGKPPVFDDQLFDEMFATLHEAVKGYVRTHKLPVKRGEPLIGQFMS